MAVLPLAGTRVGSIGVDARCPEVLADSVDAAGPLGGAFVVVLSSFQAAGPISAPAISA
jgi:hypothetical protein